MGIHKAFRNKKDTVIPGANVQEYNPLIGYNFNSYDGGRVNTDHNLTQDGRGRNPSMLKPYQVSYNRQSLMSPINIPMPRQEGRSTYSNQDVKRADSDILVLSEAMKNLRSAMDEARNVDPNLIAQNKGLLDSFNKASQYAMKQGFSMDQAAINDRLDSYGYKNSSGKLGAMVGLAKKRVDTYINNALQQEQLAQDAKYQLLDNSRKDYDAYNASMNPLIANRESIQNQIHAADELGARNLQTNTAQKLEQNRIREDFLFRDAENSTADRQAAADSTLANNRLFQEAFSDSKNRVYNIAAAHPEQRIKNGKPGGFGALLARGLARGVTVAAGGALGGAFGGAMANRATRGWF